MNTNRIETPNRQNQSNFKGFDPVVIASLEDKKRLLEEQEQEHQERLAQLRTDLQAVKREIYHRLENVQDEKLTAEVNRILWEGSQLDPDFYKRRSPYSLLNEYRTNWKKPATASKPIEYTRAAKFFLGLMAVKEDCDSETAKQAESLENYLQEYTRNYCQRLIKNAKKAGYLPQKAYFEAMEYIKENKEAVTNYGQTITDIESIYLWNYIFTHHPYCNFARFIFNSAVSELLTDQMLDQWQEQETIDTKPIYFSIPRQGEKNIRRYDKSTRKTICLNDFADNIERHLQSTYSYIKTCILPVIKNWNERQSIAVLC